MTVSLETIRHPALGSLCVLGLAGPAGGGRARLNAREALTVSRALAAVRAGTSAEKEIYMSPIASDYDVVAAVGADGVELAVGGVRLALDWAAVDDLSARLGAWAVENGAT